MELKPKQFFDYYELIRFFKQEKNIDVEPWLKTNLIENRHIGGNGVILNLYLYEEEECTNDPAFVALKEYFKPKDEIKIYFWW